MDEVILEAVSQNDEAYEGEMLSDDEPFDVERPSTADEGDGKVTICIVTSEYNIYFRFKKLDSIPCDNFA